MGFPSSHFEKYYRNARREVKTYLDTKHGDAYKLWNLCAEKHYPERKFDERVCHDYRFYDHESPPWKLVVPCCRSLQQFLQRSETSFNSNSPPPQITDLTPSSPLANNSQKVVVVHCKAGKGRTGVIIASFLIFDRRVKTSQEALEMYAAQRTKNGKGVTIPSQQRYVHYMGRWMNLGGREPHPNQQLRLTKVRCRAPLSPMTVSFECSDQEKRILFQNPLSNVQSVTQTTEYVEFNCNVLLKDDIKIVITKKDGSKFKCLFHVWFNVQFIENGYEKYDKLTIDKVHKDKDHKKFPSDMTLELFFNDANGNSISSRRAKSSSLTTEKKE